MRKIVMVFSLLLVLIFFLAACGAVDSQEVSETVEAQQMHDDESMANEEATKETTEEMETETVVVEEPVVEDEIVENVEETVAEESQEAEGGTATEEAAEEGSVEETADLDEAEELEVESAGTVHNVEFVNSGFEPTEITIAAGDTIQWVNAREGNLDQAMLLGTRSYTNIRSEMLEIGESYSWTFDEAGEYIFVDAILTTYVHTVTVE